MFKSSISFRNSAFCTAAFFMRMRAAVRFFFLLWCYCFCPSLWKKKRLCSFFFFSGSFADTVHIENSLACSPYYCTRPLAILITSDTTRSLSVCTLFFFFLLQPASFLSALEISSLCFICIAVPKSPFLASRTLISQGI